MKLKKGDYEKGIIMNWLSQEEIRRRAEISDEEALNVSIEHWEQVCEAKRIGESIIGHYTSGDCGLCQRKEYRNKNCSSCFLWDDNESGSGSCSQEWRNFSDNKTLENAKAMLNRLYQEKGKMLCKKDAKKECKEEKPKALRHGDYGYDKEGEALMVEGQGFNMNDLLSRNKSNMACGEIRNGKHCTRTFSLLGNIFDDLARNAEDLEKFEVKVIGGKTLISKIVANDRIELESGFGFATATLDEATEIAKGILQEVATAKRRQAKDR